MWEVVTGHHLTLRAPFPLFNNAQWVSTSCSRARSSPIRASRPPQRFRYAARWLKSGDKRSEASGALYLLELCAEQVVDRFFSTRRRMLVCLLSSPRSQTHYVEEDGLELMISASPAQVLQPYLFRWVLALS